MEKLKNFFLYNTSNKQTAIKNTFWLTLSEISGRLLKMILIVYMARKLGAAGWGIFSYALSIGSILMILSDIGIGNLITREATQKKEGYKIFISTALFLKGILLIISIILVIFVSPFISNIPEANKLFVIIAIIFFFDSLTIVCFAINRACEKMERELVVKTAMNLAILILGIILLKINPAPLSIAIAYAVGSIISFIVIITIIRKDIKEFISKIDMKLFNLIFKITWPFAIITLMSSIMVNTDTFMLGIWKDSTEIGLYASVQRIQQFILIIPSVITTAIFPLMSRLVNNNENKQFRSVMEKSLSFIMIVGIPIAIGGILLANQIIPLVFGPGYLGAIPLMQILMLMLLVSFPLILLSNAIFSYNKQKSLSLAYLFGVISNVLLNLVLIPKLGAKGASIATLISTTIITFIVWKKMEKINNFEILSKFKRIFLIIIIMTISILILKYLGINVILNIIISSLLYLSFLLLLKEPILAEIRKIINI